MNRESDPTSPPGNHLSRRAALGRVVATGLGLAGFHAMAAESVADPAEKTPEFVPENDYPYFGCEPRSE